MASLGSTYLPCRAWLLSAVRSAATLSLDGTFLLQGPTPFVLEDPAHARLLQETACVALRPLTLGKALPLGSVVPTAPTAQLSYCMHRTASSL